MTKTNLNELMDRIINGADPFERAKMAYENFAEGWRRANQATRGIDDLMDRSAELARSGGRDTELLVEIADRLERFAVEKERSRVIDAITASTAAEMRCLSEVYRRLAQKDDE